MKQRHLLGTWQTNWTLLVVAIETTPIIAVIVALYMRMTIGQILRIGAE